jgi:hypothetical protein
MDKRPTNANRPTKAANDVFWRRFGEQNFWARKACAPVLSISETPTGLCPAILRKKLKGIVIVRCNRLRTCARIALKITATCRFLGFSWSGVVGSNRGGTPTPLPCIFVSAEYKGVTGALPVSVDSSRLEVP